jgi:hypothetical protein
MPTRIHPPACLLEVFDDYFYPTIDFSRVAFFTGMPPVLGWGSQLGLTMPAAGFTSQINVYLRESAYDPCDFEDFLLIAHELVHVLQIQQSFLGGRIPGWSVGKYVGCWTGWLVNGVNGTDCDNSLEREAYEWANGCPPHYSGGILRFCLTNFHPSSTNPNLNLAQSPCDCSDAPWYRRSLVPGTTVTFYDELPRACYGDVKTDSDAESWKCLLSPLALIFALVSGIVWGIGSIIYQGISSIIGWVGGLFGSSKSWIWFTAFDGTTSDETGWFIPDVPVTKHDHTKTSEGPALAVYNGLLYMAYKSSGDDHLWYNYFDGHNWLDQDIQITKDGHTKTSAGPALAVYNGLLYMAYKSSGDDDIWYNVFDGHNWQGQDEKITRYGSVYTGKPPALAGFGKLLYLAYRDNS